MELQHVIESQQFTREKLEELFEVTRSMELLENTRSRSATR
jgi:aspartate carbamoyltransferase catalytic subunit